MFEIVDANELTQAMRTRTSNPAALVEEYKALRTYGAVETVLRDAKAGRIGGFRVRPSETDLAEAKRAVEMDPNVTPWPLRQATRRIKNALKTVPGIKIGGVKAADGNVVVREGGNKAETAPVLFTQDGTDALIAWFHSDNVDKAEREKLLAETAKIPVVVKMVEKAEADAKAAADAEAKAAENADAAKSDAANENKGDGKETAPAKRETAAAGSR